MAEDAKQRPPLSVIQHFLEKVIEQPFEYRKYGEMVRKKFYFSEICR